MIFESLFLNALCLVNQLLFRVAIFHRQFSLYFAKFGLQLPKLPLLLL